MVGLQVYFESGADGFADSPDVGQERNPNPHPEWSSLLSSSGLLHVGGWWVIIITRGIDIYLLS